MSANETQTLVAAAQAVSAAKAKHDSAVKEIAAATRRATRRAEELKAAEAELVKLSAPAPAAPPAPKPGK